MCAVNLRDKLPCIELRQQLGIEDMVKVVQTHCRQPPRMSPPLSKVVQLSILQWYDHVLKKDDDNW